ncbi:hypothetical protein JCM11641_003961 [Rhodosporidiobolus odoratus]
MSKRSLPYASANEPATKRTTLSSSSGSTGSTLNSFFPTTHRPSPPSPLVHSDPLTDRSSTFIAHAAPTTTSHAAHQLQDHVRKLRSSSHPVECSHEILAFRIMAPKAGKSGVESVEDWDVKEFGEDDGEKGASAVVKEVLRKEGAVDVGVVVSRLYGGIMLGPARFTHIRTVTTQAIQRLTAALALPTLLTRLSTLDSEIASLSSAPPPEPTKQTAQYASLDVVKAERLIAAREKRVELLRKKKEKEQEQERGEIEALHKAAEAEERREREKREAEDEADEEAAREAESEVRG